MKILHVIDRMYPRSPHQGGAPQSLASLVHAQANLGFAMNVEIHVNDRKLQVKKLLGGLLATGPVRTLRFLISGYYSLSLLG